MKKTAFLSVLCSVSVFLSGCAENENLPDSNVTETVISSSAASVTETDKTAAKSSEEETTATEETAAEFPFESFDDFDGAEIKTGIIDLAEARDENKAGYGGGCFINEGIFAERGYYTKDEDSISAIYLYDTSDWSLKRIIDIPDGWRGFSGILPNENADVLLKASIYRFDDDYKDVNGVMTLYKDGSCDVSDIRTADCCGRKLFKDDQDIYILNEDGSRKKIIKLAEYEELVQIIPLDENRFAYQISDLSDMGAYYAGRIGIYDFTGDKNIPAAELENHLLLSAVNGKLYSHLRLDLHNSELYVTDIETLETKLLSDTPFEAYHKYGFDYAVTGNGKYILCAGEKNKDTGTDAAVYILDAESGEVVSDHKIPDEMNYSRSLSYGLYCVGENTAVISDNHNERLFIFNIDI